MSEWKEVRLQEVTDIIGDGIHGTPSYDNNGEYYFINGSNLCDGKIVINNDTKRVNYEEFLKHKKELNQNTILISINGTIGNTALYQGEKCILGKSACYINVNHLYDKYFIYYILSSRKFSRSISFQANGTTIKNVSLKQIREYSFFIPSTYEDQKDISSILRHIDAKIETNNKLNEKLEEMAQAIFKSWFVDFEPFKNQPFYETELGMIPEGWEVCYLGDFIHEIETGKREKGGAINYGIPSIGAEKIERISYYDFSSEKYISWDFYNNLKKGKIKDCDVLLYKDGAYTGKSTMFIDNFPYKECAINEHVFILRTNKKRYQSFLYLFLNQKKIKELIHSLASSKAAQPGLNQKEISSVMFIKPSEDILNNFENMIFPLLKHIVHNLKENQRLASLRDTLLPRLMSGEIKI